MAEPPDDFRPRNTLYEQQTRSGRRLTRLRLMLYRLAAPVALALVRFWWLTCRIVRVEGADRLAAALAGGAALPVYWHQHQLFCVRYLLEQRHLNLTVGFTISPSVDGEIPAMLARRVGLRVLRGSSSHAGARALRDYYSALKDGVSLAITPDGPYGPRYGFKPGPILLAQMSGRPMLPMAYCASRAWKFRAWDRFVLPYPWARIAIAIGEPRYVPRTLDPPALQRWQSQMEAELLALYRTAERALAAA